MDGGYPRQLGPFVLADPLPQEGPAARYLALSWRGRRAAACLLKCLVVRTRLQRAEAETLRRAEAVAGRLSHAGLARSLGLGVVEGRQFLAQAYQPGISLAELEPGVLARAPRLAAHVAREVARALAYLHGFEGQALVHGRVVPENIRLGFAGEVKLLDAGLAAAAGQPALSLGEAALFCSRYRAPETLAGGRGDARGDIYSLAVVLWETLTGRRFEAQALDDDQQAGARRLPPTGNFPPALAAVLARALDRDPERRQQTAGALADALAAAAPVRLLARRGLRRALAGSGAARRSEEAARAALRAAATRLDGGAPPVVAPAAPGSSWARRTRVAVTRWTWGWRGLLLPVALAAGGVILARLAPFKAPAPAQAPLPGVALQRASRPSRLIPPVVSPPVLAAPVLAVPVVRAPGMAPPLVTAAPPVSRAPRLRARSLRASDEERAARSTELVKAAEARFHWRDLEGAERLAREAVQAGAGDAHAHYFLGFVLLANDKPAEAAGAFRRALALDPDHPRAADKLRIAEERALQLGQ